MPTRVLRSAAALLPLLLALLLGACGGGGGGGGGGGRGPSAVVDGVTPAPGAVDVSPATTVTVRFRTPMDEATLVGGSLLLVPAGSSDPVDADITVSLGKTEALIAPLGALSAGITYQVRLSGSARRADGREIRTPWFSEFRVGGGGGPPPPPPPPAQTGFSRVVGPLEKGRSGHAAVALDDGRVAVFGGFDTSSTVTASIEIFDPSTEEWTTSAASLGTARARLTATVLGDGRVLLAGGETASSTDIGLDVSEIYDPALDAVLPAGVMMERRTRHRAVRLTSGKVLLVGGSRTDSSGAPNYSRATSEIFDPSTVVYGSGPWMTVARAGHQATLLGDGRVLVTGGHGTSVQAEVFDPVAGSFVSGGTNLAPRRDHAAVLLADGSVLSCGGGNYSAERWIPAENRWVQLQNMGDIRSLHTAVRLPSGRVFVAGGEKPGVGGGTTFHTATEYYNPGTGSFLFPTLPTWIPRSGHTCTPLPGGDWLLVGGKSNVLGGSAVRTTERFHLD